MTPERARKIAKDCADSWYGGAAGLNLKEAITQGILEALQETEGDLVATRAERDTYRQDLAAARAALREMIGTIEIAAVMPDAIHKHLRVDWDDPMLQRARAALAGEKK